ncbi:NADH-quinone oxidoreductase subunit E [Vannielia litorea]|uniref:NADH-quinone oxidoreductase subunit E n=1 Tax=Vannielia litorea TaxID=1217970 RepID=UPI001C97FAE3|nr:NADH-quinone oxidoreductase subunit E [Vannielia litorea]MBY6047607.1 NADH-quinone oxidoreductase subunit E [Vannielia litorea]MBY6075021.1 NADH-quinone oxidoreductase subunit E [Vannielia litorea]
MLRRLYHDQPDSFAFTPANQAWAEGQITKYPEGRQASAVIPLLWRAQEQEGWLTRPAIEHVADMLGMADIRVLEVASFYFMFQLQPVGSVAHIQVCGTTSCMICGAEDLIGVCREKIAANPHEISEDGKFSWEEVECLGSCANAPMAQIGKDYYEDLTAKRFGEMIDEFRAGKVPVPGPQNGRYGAEPLSGLTSLTEHESGKTKYNASVQLATDIGDTVKRIDGSEVPLLTPWSGKNATPTSKARAEAAGLAGKPEKPEAPKSAVQQAAEAKKKPAAKAKQAEADHEKVDGAGDAEREEDAGKDAKDAKGQATAPSGGAGADKSSKDGGRASEAKAEKPGPKAGAKDAEPAAGSKPETLSEARGGKADDLKAIKGVGPKLEKLLHSMGFYHYDQIAKWTDEELEWVNQNLEGFKGRARRDQWVGQARTLAEGGDTEFSNRVKKGDVY